jgi:hypothetical protein
MRIQALDIDLTLPESLLWGLGLLLVVALILWLIAREWEKRH